MAGEGSWELFRGARVLVVEDDEDMRALLVARLELAGCVVLEAATGGAARDRVTSPEEAPIDLMLIDLRMPGPNGIQVLRELRATHRLPPAILMTAFAQPRVRAEALSLGIHILDKPFEFETLRRVAAALLVSRRIEQRRVHDPSHPSHAGAEETSPDEPLDPR